MKTLKEMNLAELKELHTEWVELYSVYGADNFRDNALAVENEILSRCVETVEVINKITVEYEVGYKWSVTVVGEGESRDTQLTKAEAMRLARYIKKNEFKGKGIIEAQTLTKAERAENMAYLHEHTLTYSAI